MADSQILIIYEVLYVFTKSSRVFNALNVRIHQNYELFLRFALKMLLFYLDVNVLKILYSKMCWKSWDKSLL